MKRTLILLAATLLTLSACAPGRAPTSAPTAAALLPTHTPAPTATPTHPPSPTATPTVTPTATPTPIPTLPPEQLGGLTGVPDPRYSNPELFDLNDPDAPIPQFVHAMRMAGIEVAPEQVVQGLEFEVVTGADGKEYVVGSYVAKDIADNQYLVGFFAQRKESRWTWQPLTTLQAANWRNILIGVEVGPGPDADEPGYRNFVFRNTNLFVVSGAMSTDWIQYGRTFVPEMVDSYYRENPNGSLTLGINHLFYQDDQKSWPRQLYDEKIPLEERKQILYSFIDNHINDVFDIITPLMEKYSSLKIIANVSNEAFWEYNGEVGWKSETPWPMYDILGESWISEVYIRFDRIRESRGLPRERFILLMNDYGTQIPGPKAEIFLTQRKEVINEIAERMGVNPDDIQLDIGIQFGLGDTYIDDDYVIKRYLNPTLNYLRNNPQVMIEHLQRMGNEGDIYITEMFANDQEQLIQAFRVLAEVESVRMINFWDALNRAQPDNIGIVDKANYLPNAAYYNLLYYLIKH